MLFLADAPAPDTATPVVPPIPTANAADTDVALMTALSEAETVTRPSCVVLAAVPVVLRLVTPVMYEVTGDLMEFCPIEKPTAIATPVVPPKPPATDAAATVAVMLDESCDATIRPPAVIAPPDVPPVMSAWILTLISL